MTRTLVTISSGDWEALRESLFTSDGNENAAVLLCGISDTKAERRLLVRRIVPVPSNLYLSRLSYHLEVAPSFYNGVVTECLRTRLTPVIVHSHPGHSEAWYSGSDDHGEKRLLPTLASLLPDVLPASLVITHSSVTGRVLLQGKFASLSGLRVVGTPVTTFDFGNPAKDVRPVVSKEFDRQVRAFGSDGQRMLESLKVAIVGVGGIGSLIAEQLVRAGSRDILLIDNDDLEESNISRVFGTTKSDISQKKVEVLSDHLKTITSPKISIDARSAVKQSVLLTLRDRDVVFSCVDNDLTRAILNRFAHQYLIPLIDHGARLDGREGRITAAAGRVSITGTGLTCLRCSNHINSERIRAESMSREERAQLEREGYIMGIDEPAPAIVSINTVIAGLGATAGINIFVNLTGGVQPLDQIYDARSGSLFPVSSRHEPGCDICDDRDGVKGLGDLQIVSAYE